MTRDIKGKIFDIAGTTDTLTLLLSAGDVSRYHQEGEVKAQPVNSHTWRMLIILLHFWPNASRELILAVTYHDIAERYTGDLTKPMKTNNPNLATILRDLEMEYHKFVKVTHPSILSYEDFTKLKCCDYIELCITCYYQPGWRARQIYQRGSKLVQNHANKLEACDRAKVIAFMNTLYNDAMMNERLD